MYVCNVLFGVHCTAVQRIMDFPHPLSYNLQITSTLTTCFCKNREIVFQQHLETAFTDPLAVIRDNVGRLIQFSLKRHNISPSPCNQSLNTSALVHLPHFSPQTPLPISHCASSLIFLEDNKVEGNVILLVPF